MQVDLASAGSQRHKESMQCDHNGSLLRRQPGACSAYQNSVDWAKDLGTLCSYTWEHLWKLLELAVQTGKAERCLYNASLKMPCRALLPELLVSRGSRNVMHAEHAEHSQLQQHVFTSLLCRPLVEKGLKSPLPAQQIIQICHSSWQNFITVIEVHLGEENTYRPKNIAVSIVVAKTCSSVN